MGSEDSVKARKTHCELVLSFMSVIIIARYCFIFTVLGTVQLIENEIWQKCYLDSPLLNL